GDKAEGDQNSLPGLTHGVLAHAPGSDGNERDDRRVETVKQLLCIRQRGETVVEDRQDGHHQHRRQNKAEQRKGGASPSSQPESQVGDRVTGTRSGQTLTEGQSFDEIVFAEPASFMHDDTSSVRENSYAA